MHTEAQSNAEAAEAFALDVSNWDSHMQTNQPAGCYNGLTGLISRCLPGLRFENRLWLGNTLWLVFSLYHFEHLGLG